MESDIPHIVNLINSVIGVGILAMPFCMSQCGLILGTIVLLFCGFITLQSCLMLISSAKAKNKTRYDAGIFRKLNILNTKYSTYLSTSQYRIFLSPLPFKKFLRIVKDSKFIKSCLYAKLY